MTSFSIVPFLRQVMFLGVLIVALMYMGAVLFVDAVASSDVVFPVAELGDCASEDACKAYCDVLEHKDACLVFAEKHQLLSSEELDRARQLPPEGPGGCRIPDACRSYCDADEHHEECLAFAEKHDVMSHDEVARMRNAEEIDEGERPGPGGCRGDACKDYCEDDEAHFDECLDFGVKNGFIKDKEAEIARTLMRGGGPGGCTGEKECRVYCEDPANIEKCVTFGKEHGLISDEEAKHATLLAKGGPGGCKSESECRAFCEDAANQETCLAFAEEHDLIPKEELERAKKIIGKTGPGGCVGGACREYCEDAGHQEECFEFAEREGLMSKDEAARARKFLKASAAGGPGGCQGRACKEYCEAVAHREECFEFAKKNGLLSEGDERMMEVDRKLNAKLQESGGPGGCTSEEECKTYCGEPAHVEDCIAFASAHGGVSAEEARGMLEDFVRGSDHEFRKEKDLSDIANGHFEKFEILRDMEQRFRGMEGGFGAGGPTFSGPGGCVGPDECIAFCSDEKNHDECGSFRPPSSGEGFGGNKQGDEVDRRRPAGAVKENSGGAERMPDIPGAVSWPDECKTISECKTYCQEHMQEPGVAERCRGFLGLMQAGEEHRFNQADGRMPEGGAAPQEGIRVDHEAPPFNGEPTFPLPDMRFPANGGGEGLPGEFFMSPGEAPHLDGANDQPPAYQNYGEPIQSIPPPSEPSSGGATLREPYGIFGLLLWPLLRVIGQ